MNFIDNPFVDVRVCWQPLRDRSCLPTGLRLPALLFLTLLMLGLAGCGSTDGSHGYADRPPSNPTALVDSLNVLLLHGTMSSAMRSSIVGAVNAVAATNTLKRARTAVYLVATSSQYQVER